MKSGSMLRFLKKVLHNSYLMPSNFIEVLYIIFQGEKWDRVSKKTSDNRTKSAGNEPINATQGEHGIS